MTPSKMDSKTLKSRQGEEELQAAAHASQKIDKDSPELAWWRTSMQTRDTRLGWWREARFGMFIHWGVYSQLGGDWHGQHYGGYAEHIQRKFKIPIPVYHQQVAGSFNPTRFNADEWVRLAKEAGMGYLIITAKHHDGFAMYDSKVSADNIVQGTPYQHDPMHELRAACTKYGVKFGFYYSHAFDWGDAEAPGNDWDYQNPGGDLLLHGGRYWWESSPQFLPQVRCYIDRKAIPQLRELAANYQPDIFWFDTPGKIPDSENLRVLQAVREAAPNVVINGRLVRGLGDYDNTADRPAEFPPHDRDWEAIPTTNDSYGWNQNDRAHKPPGHFIQLVAKAAARGGNMLLNIGPRGDGTIDTPDVHILEGIAQWMKVNATSIRGTQRTPLAPQAWGESTRRGNTLYLHVFEWPRDGKLVVGGLKSEVQSATLLSDAQKRALPVQRLNTDDVVIQVPATAPDANDSVVVLEVKGEIATDARLLLSPTVATNSLHVFNGQIEGQLRYGAGKTQDAYVMNWSSPGDTVKWPVRLNQATEFVVGLTYDAEANSAGGTYEVKVGTQTFTGSVKPGKQQSVALGQVQMPAGSFDLSVRPTQIKGEELMKLRSIVLTPLKP